VRQIYTKDPATRQKAIDFFKREFELDYLLATLPKPYVAILDGNTKRTIFAMPETKIGYCPDVGGSYFLSRMDGELGTYLALTSERLCGYDVFDHGFATHFIPSRRIPMLLQRLAGMEDAHISAINNTIEEFSDQETPAQVSSLTSATLSAIDSAFRHDRVEKIIEDLEALSTHKDVAIAKWANNTLDTLRMRSPTSVKVALKAIRAGRQMSLSECLDMELKIATAFCTGASPDFVVGVQAVLVDKIRDRPQWSPTSLNEVTDEIVSRFFSPDSSYLKNAPTLSIPEHLTGVTPNLMKYALPTAQDISNATRILQKDGVTLGELLAHFKQTHQNKSGVESKVAKVALRKCREDDRHRLHWIDSVISP